MTHRLRFETLIELHHDEIYRYLWRLLNSAGRSDSVMEAQDLTQEVFTRAYAAYGRLRPGSNHRAWLYKIASNRAYTALKQGQRTEDHSELSPDEADDALSSVSPPPDRQVEQREALEAIRRSLSRLPPKQGAAVVLRHVEGLSYPEIAQALDCSEDSARANVSQGLRRLRQELGEDIL
jgi:RNA polymerase sigma-70 factor (ECF subfamily)